MELRYFVYKKVIQLPKRLFLSISVIVKLNSAQTESESIVIRLSEKHFSMVRSGLQSRSILKLDSAGSRAAITHSAQLRRLALEKSLVPFCD